MHIRLAGFEKESVVDGPGIRLVIFTQGCTHHCEGCHNPQSIDPQGGEIYALEAIKEEIKAAHGISGVTFSGGEPFLQAEAVAELAKFTKNLSLNVVVYTGYLYEELAALAEINPYFQEILDYADILVDGPFVLAERDLSLAFRGSRNQRVIDLQNTKKNGYVVTYL